MAHNPLIRLGADWSLDDVVTAGEFSTLDTRQFQGINGDLGGTWAPSDQIVIGGDGLYVTGPSRFDGVTYLEMAVSGEIALADGSILSVPDGASIVCNSNTTTAIDMESGSEMLVHSGASVTFDGGSNWPLLTPARVVAKDHLRLGGSLREDGQPYIDPATDVPAVSASMTTLSGTTKVSAIISAARPDASTTSIEWTIAIDDPPNGQTLSQVIIGSTGTSLLVVAPTYTVQRVHLTTLVVENLSLATADAHLVAGTFNTLLNTSITCTTNNVINTSTYRYQVLCTTGTGTAPSHRWIWYACTGGYSVTELRP